MVSEISDNDFDADDLSLYRKINDMNDSRKVACAGLGIDLPINNLKGESQAKHLSLKDIRPMMSGGMRVKVEATFEDKNGNKIGVGVTVEKDNESNSGNNQTQASDSDNKPDSLDRDFDRDQ